MKLEPKPTNLKIAQFFNILHSAIDCSLVQIDCTKSFFENLLKIVSEQSIAQMCKSIAPYFFFFEILVLNQVWEKNIRKTYTRLMF